VGSSRNLGGANKGLGEAPKKAARGRSMKARPTQSRKGVKGGLRPFSSAPCRVQGQRPLWGLVQRPNCSSPDQSQGSRQQRRRQRSVPASNFALPQERPQAAFPPRFREEPFCELAASVVEELHRHVSAAEGHPHADFRLLRLHNLCAGAR
jgi:hypothetical protein